MEGILIPQKVFIGDTAEFLYPLENLYDANINTDILIKNLNNINKIEKSEQMTITKIEIKTQDKIDYLSISFIPWDTGDIHFPNLKVIGIEKELPMVNIASILESSKTEILQAPRTPVLIPGTRKIIYSISIIFILLIFIILSGTTALKKNIFKNSFVRIQRKRIKKFYKQLKKLKKKSNKKMKSLSDLEKEEYINKCLKEFEIALRTYCINIIRTGKTKNISDNPTYSEILNKLEKEFINTIDIYLEFKDVFNKLQNLRFAQVDLTKINLSTEINHFINKSNYLIKISEEQIQKNRKEENELNYDKI